MHRAQVSTGAQLTRDVRAWESHISMRAADWVLRPDNVARVVRAVLATGPNVWIREAFVTPLQVPKAQVGQRGGAEP